MFAVYCIVLATSSCCPAAGAPSAPVPDTIRLEVGSPEVNGKVYAPHAARVRVRTGEGEGRVVAEWTNELTLGDSAGRPIHRWITRGTRFLAAGDTVTWEIRQTYDAVTLAPYGYASSSSTGAFSRLKLDGRRVRGTRKLPNDSTVQQVDLTLDRPGFIASASDLVPLAVGLQEGKVMTAPVWGPNMTRSELRIFTVVGRGPVVVEGSEVTAWKVEERRYADRKLLATWYLTEGSPYMVYGEVILPDGQVQRMSEVAIPGPAREASGVVVREARPDTGRSRHTPADTRFMQHMIGHHAQALEMTKLVPGRTSREDMRLLAERIEVSQRDEIGLIRQWLQQRGEEVPALDAHHHAAMGHPPLMPGMLTAAELAQLAKATGAEFDRLFLEYMIRHHEGALTMVKDLFGTPGAAQETETYRFATDVEADQRAEISRMRALLAKLPAR